VKIPVLTLLSLLLLCASAQGQLLTKLRHMSGPGNDYISALGVDSEGNTYISFYLGWMTGQTENYHILGEDLVTGANSTGNFIKLNKDGQVVWRTSVNGTISSIDFDDHDNPHVIVAGGSPSFKVAKLDKEGHEIWTNTHPSTDGYGYELKISPSGDIFVTGTARGYDFYGMRLIDTGCCPDHDFLLKLNSAGEFKWIIGSPPGVSSSGHAIDFDINGNVILGGKFYYSTTWGPYTLQTGDGYNTTYVVAVDGNGGGVMWAKSFAGELADLDVDFDGSIYLTGTLHAGGTFGNYSVQNKGRTDFYLAKLQSNGNVAWLRHEGTVGDDYGSSVQIQDDNLYVTGKFSGNVDIDGAQVGYIIGPTGFVSRFQKNDGKASWIAGYGTYSNDGGWDPSYQLNRIDDRRFQLAGGFYGTIAAQNDSLVSRARDIFIGELVDTVFFTPGAKLTGKIFASGNGNCDPNQPGLKNIIVKAEPGPVYGITRADGQYQLNLQPGTYTITQILPKKKLGIEMIETCTPANPSVTINTVNDTPAPVNFGNTLLAQPYLEADVVSGRFRRCFSNDVVVQYCNDGYATANNVVLTVDFPEYVMPLSSNIPWAEKKGRQLIYKFASVPAGFCQRIVIRDSVLCGDESIRGLTQCVNVRITPLNNAGAPHPSWDGSQLILNGKCLENGFVRLSLKNTGSGSMADSADFKIYTDDVLAYQHRYRLVTHDSLVLQLPANGKTIRMEATTTPHSPQSSLTVSIEACGSGSGGLVSKGYVNAFYQNDSEAEIETFCDVILDSYDPNDKQVFPAGITSEHRILGSEELEYVVRFQNTGNDVAYNIVIQDDLDPLLDLSTLRIGLASHPVSFEVTGEGKATLIWRFKNIMLPDSTTDEPGSHGFVKFKIQPLPNLGKGTVIRNKANILFDFNSAISTNEVFNTIGLPDTEPTNALTIQDCDENIEVNAGLDQQLVLCDQASVTFDVPVTGALAYYTMQEGLANVHLSSGKVFIDELAAGENRLSYIVLHCNNIDSSRIDVKRVVTEKPVVTGILEWCADDLEHAKITALGHNISWYADPGLTTKIFEGSAFRPTETSDLFVVDEQAGCVSASTVTHVTVHPTPEPPQTLEAFGCSGTLLLLEAAGTDVLWYNTIDETSPASAGPQYKTSFATDGQYVVFATQTDAGCESEKAALPVTIKSYVHEESFMMNIITPNGDDRNETFYIPTQNFTNCAGEFKNVIIYNRYGMTVFSSDSADFTWNADSVPAGVYYYSIFFSDQKFHGTITVGK